MAIALVQQQGITGTTATSAPVLGAAPITGNLLVRWTFQKIATIPTIATGGWSIAGTGLAAGSGGSVRACQLFYKVVLGGQSATMESATVSTSGWTDQVVEYSGVNTATPLNTGATAVSATTTGAQTTPSITPSANANGGLTVCGAAQITSATTYSGEIVGGSATGVAERVDTAGTAITAVVWDRIDTSLAATARAGAATPAVGASWVAQEAVFNAAVAAAALPRATRVMQAVNRAATF